MDRLTFHLACKAPKLPFCTHSQPQTTSTAAPLNVLGSSPTLSPGLSRQRALSSTRDQAGLFPVQNRRDFPLCFFAPATPLALCILPAGALLGALGVWSLIRADGQRANLSPGAVQPGQRLELSKFQRPHVAGDRSGCLL